MNVFLMTLKRIFSNKLCLVFLVIFPVISFLLLNMGGTQVDENEFGDVRAGQIRFAVVDNDDTILSNALVNRLGLRYNVIMISQDEISETLIENVDVSWVLKIENGFEADVLVQNANLKTLQSYTLAITDVAILGELSAQNITRSLMLLGTNDEAIISQWQEESAVNLTFADIGIDFRGLAGWLAMFGFVSILTAYFVIRTLTEDKMQGMPDRIGALPISPRGYLLQGTLAAFAATQISVLLTLLSLHFVYGEVPNGLTIFVMMSVFNLFAVSLVLTIMSLTKTIAAASTVMSMLGTLLSMLGGLFWPLELVPDIMQRIAWFTPGYWFGRGLNNAGEFTFEGFTMPILFMLAFTVVTLLIGGLKRVQKMEIE